MTVSWQVMLTSKYIRKYCISTLQCKCIHVGIRAFLNTLHFQSTDLISVHHASKKCRMNYLQIEET